MISPLIIHQRNAFVQQSQIESSWPNKVELHCLGATPHFKVCQNISYQWTPNEASGACPPGLDPAPAAYWGPYHLLLLYCVCASLLNSNLYHVLNSNTSLFSSY